MCKYQNFHHIHPEKDQYLYFIGPTKLEVLGQYLGNTRFDALDGTLKGYYSKYWRELNEAEWRLVPKTAKPKPAKVKPNIQIDPPMPITKSNVF